MCGNAHAIAFAEFPLAPTCLFGCDFGYSTQACGVKGILFICGAIVRHCAFFWKNSIGSNERQQVLSRVLIRRMRQLVGKRLHTKRVIDVRHRPEPPDTHMILCRTVLYAQVGQVEWNVAETLAEISRSAVGRACNERRCNRRKYRAL